MNSLYEQAEAQEDSGNLEVAIHLWKRLLNESPQPAIFCRLGLAMQELGRWKEAESAFCEALKIDTSSVESMECLGILGLERADIPDAQGLEQAERWLTKSLKLERSASTLDLLGIALKSQGRLEEARRVFLESIDRDAENASPIRHLAAIEATVDHACAIILYEKAIQIDPNFAVAHQEIGVLLEKQNDTRGARYHFQRSIEIDPLDVWSHLYLANLLAVVGEIDEARSLYQKALDLDASNEDTRRFFSNFLSSLSETG